MLRKLAVCAILAAGIASAASYSLKLSQPSTVKGSQLKPGEYRLLVENDKATFVKGKDKIDAAVKVETADKKFDATSVRYGDAGSIMEIRVGGTKTRLVFSN